MLNLALIGEWLGKSYIGPKFRIWLNLQFLNALITVKFGTEEKTKDSHCRVLISATGMGMGAPNIPKIRSRLQFFWPSIRNRHDAPIKAKFCTKTSHRRCYFACQISLHSSSVQHEFGSCQGQVLEKISASIVQTVQRNGCQLCIVSVLLIECGRSRGRLELHSS